MSVWRSQQVLRLLLWVQANGIKAISYTIGWKRGLKLALSLPIPSKMKGAWVLSLRQSLPLDTVGSPSALITGITNQQHSSSQFRHSYEPDSIAKFNSILKSCPIRDRDAVSLVLHRYKFSEEAKLLSSVQREIKNPTDAAATKRQSLSQLELYNQIGSNLLLNFDAPAIRELATLEQLVGVPPKYTKLLVNRKTKNWATRMRSPRACVAVSRLHLELGDFDKFCELALKCVKRFPNDSMANAWAGHAIAWSSSQTDQDCWQKTKIHFAHALQNAGSTPWWVATDFLRVACRFGDLDAADAVWEKYILTRLSDPSYNKGLVASIAALLAVQHRDLEKTAYWEQKHYWHQSLERKLGTRFKPSLIDLDPNQSLIILSEGGVGDEMRFMAFYGALKEQYPKTKFTVDKRLEDVAYDIYPKSWFIPVERPRDSKGRLKSPQDFTRYLSETELGLIEDQQQVSTAKILCHQFLANEGNGGHITHTIKSKGKRSAINLKRPLIGVSWRSENLLYRRLPHYLSIDQLGQILSNIDADFLCLNYFDSDAELEQLHRNYGIKMLRPSEVDFRDDFAAVMNLIYDCNCVLAVNNAVAEFAGLLGVKTIFVAPSNENNWREASGNRDIYHPNVQVISRDNKGPNATGMYLEQDEFEMFIHSALQNALSCSDFVPPQVKGDKK